MSKDIWSSPKSIQIKETVNNLKERLMKQQ